MSRNIHTKDQVHSCKNCGTQFKGNYCNECSQTAETHPITWAEIIHQIPHAIWHVDGGILYTIKQMFIRPGHTMREYIEGKRVKHFNPFLFLLIVGGFSIYLFTLGKITFINKEIDLEKIGHINHSLAHYYYLIPFLYFVITLTITDFFLYKKRNYRIPELVIFNTFCMGQINVLIILTIPILFFEPIFESYSGIRLNLRPILKGIFVFYFLFARFQFFSRKGEIIEYIKIVVQLITIYLGFQYFILQFAFYISSL